MKINMRNSEPARKYCLPGVIEALPVNIKQPAVTRVLQIVGQPHWLGGNTSAMRSSKCYFDRH